MGSRWDCTPSGRRFASCATSANAHAPVVQANAHAPVVRRTRTRGTGQRGVRRRRGGGENPGRRSSDVVLAASQILVAKIKDQGVGCLYDGSLATLGSTFVGHYPWFVTFNTLQAMVPASDDGTLLSKLVRNAAIGLVASGVSDCISNSLRVSRSIPRRPPRSWYASYAYPPTPI